MLSAVCQLIPREGGKCAAKESILGCNSSKPVLQRKVMRSISGQDMDHMAARNMMGRTLDSSSGPILVV